MSDSERVSGNASALECENGKNACETEREIASDTDHGAVFCYIFNKIRINYKLYFCTERSNAAKGCVINVKHAINLLDVTMTCRWRLDSACIIMQCARAQRGRARESSIRSLRFSYFCLKICLYFYLIVKCERIARKCEEKMFVKRTETFSDREMISISLS